MISTAREMPWLGWDPCPGDVPGTRALADELGAVARLLRQAEEGARRDAPSWAGTAARAYRERLGTFPTSLALLATSVGAVAAAVRGWAGELAALQSRADELERRMEAARRRVDDVAHAYELARLVVDRQDALEGRRTPASAWQSFEDAALDTLREVQEVRAAAERLQLEHAERADVVVADVEGAGDTALRAPWGGPPPWGEEAPDGGHVAPQRPPWQLARREVVGDLVGGAVVRHAVVVEAAADAATFYAAALGSVPVGPAAAAAAGLAAAAGGLRATLAAAVTGDSRLALEEAVAAGPAVVGAVAARYSAAARSLSSLTTSSARTVDTLQALKGSLPEEPAPEAWDAAGYVVTARRREQEVVRRDERAQEARQERGRAGRVQRCVEQPGG